MAILRIDNQAHLYPLNHLSRGVVEQLRVRLTFVNPQWEENEKRGFSNWQTPKELCYLEDHGDRLTMPRGFARQLIGILRRAGVLFRIDEGRRTLARMDFAFKGRLHPFQEEALEALVARDFGVMAAPAGAGKTVTAMGMIAERKQPALVVVHTRELLEQWVERTGIFLGIPAGEVGVIGGGKKRIGDKITVALVQSLYKCGGEVAPHVGFLIVDECHRSPARTFTEAVTAFDSRFMLGLSATPWRRDGLSRLIFWHLGDLAHQVDRAGLVEAGHILEAAVTWRETGFIPTYDPSEQYAQMLSELTQDPERNALIAADVAREARDGGGVCLVLSDRRGHCQALVDLLADHGVEARLLTGDLGNAERQRVVEGLNAGAVKVLVATGQLLGEGFDCRELSTLFLAIPIKFNGRLLQYLGRVLRTAPGKNKARVFDYLDPVGVLENAARVRARVYAD
jgi:superfamily II DNA or RNA helicase